MYSGEQDSAGRPDVRKALEKVTASPILAKSPQLVNFLTYTIEETLAGRGDRLKAYTIATDALGRGADFDPQIDPIVRVEAGRLRRALDAYYADEGRHDRLVIDLPRGSYIPRFRPNSRLAGVLARFLTLRRQLVDTARANLVLVILVALIAATVSVGFDALWMVISRIVGPDFETAQRHQPLPGLKAPHDFIVR
jgi:hypothetical protein